MGFNAEVLRVLIASPSDVQQERDEIEAAIFKWNSLYAEELNVVLLPGRWENDVAPAFNEKEAQQVINSQLVNRCDILIGVFWTKLGTPTLNHSSGTLEEINIFIENGKEIMLYFIDRAIPRDSDFEQVRSVDEFKSKYRGLYAPYNSNEIINHLYRKVKDYKRNSGAKVTRSEISEVQNNESSVEDLILSNVLSLKEYLLLYFIIDTENRNLGSRWMAEDTISKIEKWQLVNGLNSNIDVYYEDVVATLCERGILEVAETTSYGNPRLYTMPINKYDQIRGSQKVIKKIRSIIIEEYHDALPF